MSPRSGSLRLTLMHNPGAGDARPSREELIALGREAGYRVRYQGTDAKDFASALTEPADVVVAAGGDGTVAKVAKELVGRDLPLAIIPLGTANNVALTLGVGGSARDIMHGLADAGVTPLAVARATAPWGTGCFIESVGTGFFGSVLRRGEDRQARAGADHATTPVPSAARNILRALETYRSVHHGVVTDGDDLSDTYLLVEVMNIRSIGPRMVLAPAADPGDGYLDLVLVRETDRASFSDYLALLAAGTHAPVTPELLETRRARRVSLTWDAADGHLDDEPWPGHGIPEYARDPARSVDVEIVDPPIRVLVPVEGAAPGGGGGG
jgi:diacylglycerol kinase (ATP)